MVMSTHIIFPAIETEPGIPATLSEKVLTGLLRKQLNYDGVIITDDMEMGAIAENFGTREAVVRAIKAGADIVLVCHSLERQTQSIEAVKQAVEKGEIDEARIDESVRRILRLKAKDAFLKQPYADVEKATELSNQPRSRKSGPANRRARGDAGERSGTTHPVEAGKCEKAGCVHRE